MQRILGTGLLAVLVCTLVICTGCPYLTFEADDAGTTDSDTDIDTDTDTDSDADGDTSTPEMTTFSGIDLLIVMDNSGSMEQEQKIMATSIYNLINMIADPINPWSFKIPSEVRAAVVSSDLGLQYGPNHSVEGFPYGHQITTCTEAGTERGDDGRFQTKMPGTVAIASDQIQCSGDGNQCPAGWSCQQEVCQSPSGLDEYVNCPYLENDARWIETSLSNPNTSFATQVACLTSLGTAGCGVEQQLESAVRALSRNETQQGFLDDDHVLVVIYVSDEEDCSVAEKGLFETKEWASGTTYDPNDASKGLLNTACNLPASNEGFLFETSRYRQQLVQLKGGDPNAVVFVAIVGVPREEDAPDAPSCQGRADRLADCLTHPYMELSIGLYATDKGTPYRHFKTACDRLEGSQLVTNARPGRRYVKAAQSFGKNGYVYSICNGDWSPAMTDVATMVGEKIRD